MKRLEKQTVFFSVIVLAIVVLGLSACLDLYLWFWRGWLVPSWTISGMSLGFIMLLTVTYHVTKEKKVE